MRTIDIVAEKECRSCHGTGYILQTFGIATVDIRTPCQCVTKQISNDAPRDTDFRILPASSQEEIILEPCAADHDRYVRMGIEFCPECGKPLK